MRNESLSPTNAIFYLLGKIFMYVSALCLCIMAYIGPIARDKLFAMFPQCYFKKAIGLYCPGCGGTRAIMSLFRFRLWESFCYHPFILYGAIIYLIFMTGCFFRKHFKDSAIWIIPIEKSIYIGIAIIFIQWILKNVYLIVWHQMWIK